MAETVIAAQLYTLRSYLKTPQDIAQTMKKVKAIGYDAVQLSGLGPIDPVELKKIVDGEGLTVCATHVSFDAMRDETSRLIDEHRLWNCKHIAIGSMPGGYRNPEGYKKFAKDISEVARRFYEEGFIFSYHNHSFELEKFDGRLGLDILYEDSDPEVFNAEIDTYWIQHGGGDSAAWIRKMAGRMPLVHFKDMTVRDAKPIMAEVGEGNLNWPSILEACKEAGAEWYIVEQDICERDPFESLKISLMNLKKMGLK